MPLYEGVGLVGDKHAIVFDIGAVYTKCGFATEFCPRAIVPSSVAASSPLEDLEAKDISLIVDFNRPSDEQYHVFSRFFHQLYFSVLLVNPKERRVVIVESVLTPTKYRNLLARVLFEYFEVPSVAFAPTHLMACLPLGNQSALVVDVGYNETVVLPVFEGVPMLNCWEASTIGGRSVHKLIRSLLNAYSKVRTISGEIPLHECPEIITESVLEDLKVRACFVTHMDRGRLIQAALADPKLRDKLPKSPGNFEYPLDADKMLLVDGSIREAAMECLFTHDIDEKSVPQMIIDSLLQCPIDLRKPLAENIHVIGGSCMAPGFMARLKIELLDLLQDSTKGYAQKLPLKTVKFFKSPVKENYMAWLGGSMFGALEILPYRSISREQYQQNPDIPDWTTFVDNASSDGVSNGDQQHR